MLRFSLSYSLIVTNILFVFIKLCIADNTDVVESHKNLEESITVYLADAQKAAKQFSVGKNGVLFPMCFWDVSPQAATYINQLWDRHLEDEDIARSAKLVKKSPSSSTAFREKILPRLSKSSRAIYEEHVKEHRIKTEESPVHTVNLTPYVKFYVTHGEVDPSDPSRLVFSRKRFPFTKWMSHKFSLVCPGAADIISDLRWSLPKHGWENWNFVYYGKDLELYIRTPSNLAYEVISVPRVFNNLLKDNENFHASAGWNVVPYEIPQHVEPRADILLFCEKKPLAATDKCFFPVNCPECRISEFVFHTVSTARNLGLRNVFKLDYSPLDKTPHPLQETPIYSKLTFKEDLQKQFFQWIKDKDLNLTLLSRLEKINLKSRFFIPKTPKIIYIQKKSIFKGIFFVRDAKNKIHNIPFASKKKLFNSLLDMQGMPLSVSFKPLKGEATIAIIGSLLTTISEQQYKETSTAIEKQIRQGQKVLHNVRDTSGKVWKYVTKTK